VTSLPVCVGVEEKETLLLVINYILNTSANCLHSDLRVTIFNIYNIYIYIYIYVCVCMHVLSNMLRVVPFIVPSTVKKFCATCIIILPAT
jgi:hypothetical protein